MASHSRPRVYFAGPDVFRRNAPEHYRNLVRQCEVLGMEALVPADGEPPTSLMGGEAARAIYDTNMVLLRRSDGVIANLAPFRGTEPDSGTVFEVGMAVAIGRPVVAYGVSGTYAERVERLLGAVRADGVLRDQHDLIVEDFGLQLNLMLACSVRVEETAEQALALLARLISDVGRPGLQPLHPTS